MTSPYPLFPASSPYQPSDLPSPLGALLPSIAQSTSGLGLTPGSNPFLALQAGGGGAGGVVGAGGSTLIGSSGLGGGGSVRSVNTGSIRKEETVSLEDCLRGLGEVGRMIERAEEVLGEIKTLRGNVFGYGSIEIGGEADGGRLELLQLEYQSLIQSIYQLSISASFGALPLPLPLSLSLDTATATPIESIPVPAPAIDTASLVSWCETRAALEFSRREGVRAGGKVVLDILKGRG